MEPENFCKHCCQMPVGHVVASLFLQKEKHYKNIKQQSSFFVTFL